MLLQPEATALDAELFSPEEFEQQCDRAESSASAIVRFFARNEEESSTRLPENQRDELR
jgi:hypothetical protein